MKAYWGSRGTAPSILTSVLGGEKWSVSRPGRFNPREIAPGTHWIGDWVGSRAGTDAVVRRKIPIPCRDSNLRSSSSKPSAIQLSYQGSVLHVFIVNIIVATIL
jgi:hypothetical protein